MLSYTASYVSRIRFEEAHRKTGISIEVWDQAKENLADKGLLTKKEQLNQAEEII